MQHKPGRVRAANGNKNDVNLPLALVALLPPRRKAESRWSSCMGGEGGGKVHERHAWQKSLLSSNGNYEDSGVCREAARKLWRNGEGDVSWETGRDGMTDDGGRGWAERGGDETGEWTRPTSPTQAHGMTPSTDLCTAAATLLPSRRKKREHHSYLWLQFLFLLQGSTVRKKGKRRRSNAIPSVHEKRNWCRRPAGGAQTFSAELRGLSRAFTSDRNQKTHANPLTKL